MDFFLGQAIIDRWNTSIHMLQRLITHLNLFKSSSENVSILYRQRITTWIFIVCLTVILAVCGIYSLLSRQTKIITISNPTRADYDRLWQTYSQTLQCPCTQVAIAYSEFLYLEPHFHQLCSNRMISPDWYERLVILQGVYEGDKSFERTLGVNYFRALNTFCSLTKNLITEAYRVFSTDLFINQNALPEIVFYEQIHTRIGLFNRLTSSQFNRIFEFTRNISQISQFATRTFSNFRLELYMNGTIEFTDIAITIPLPIFPRM
jgi:hypothetical protein